MTLEQLIVKIQTKFSSFDASSYNNFLAIQFNITGDYAGTFYIEIKDGVLTIAPFEYYDHHAVVTISIENFIKVLDKKLDPVWAFTTGKLKISGSIEKVLELAKLL